MKRYQKGFNNYQKPFINKLNYIMDSKNQIICKSEKIRGTLRKKAMEAQCEKDVQNIRVDQEYDIFNISIRCTSETSSSYIPSVSSRNIF